MKESWQTESPPDGSIDAGLLLLALTTPRGIQYTQGEIAEVCGCSKSLIFHIEQRALAKLRDEIRRRKFELFL